MHRLASIGRRMYLRPTGGSHVVELAVRRFQCACRSAGHLVQAGKEHELKGAVFHGSDRAVIDRWRSAPWVE
jgi:hypothetical protein